MQVPLFTESLCYTLFHPAYPQSQDVLSKGWWSVCPLVYP